MRNEPVITMTCRKCDWVARKYWASIARGWASDHAVETGHDQFTTRLHSTPGPS